MCSPKAPQIKNVVPQASSLPDAPPEPIKIDKDGQERAKRKRNPLRIDLAAGGGGGGTSGVNI